MNAPVALFTAAGSGIGAAAARRLAADGSRVAILSSSGRGAALAERPGGLGVTGSNLPTADLHLLVDAVPVASDQLACIAGRNLRIDGGPTRSR